MDATLKSKLGSLLADNNLREQEAIKFYLDFIEELNEVIDEEKIGDDVDTARSLIEILTEIVADELNHSDKLSEAFQRITGIEKAAT